MNRGPNSQLSQSDRDWGRIVWPAIGPHLGGGEWTTAVRTTADIELGIDGHQVLGRGRDKVHRPIAMRVQWREDGHRVRYDEPWDTFSVREAELEKRLAAINAPGAATPWLTVQAYVSQRGTGGLISAAWVFTSALYRYIEECQRRGRVFTWRSQDHSTTENPFIFVPWAEVDCVQYHNPATPHRHPRDAVSWVVKDAALKSEAESRREAIRCAVCGADGAPDGVLERCPRTVNGWHIPTAAWRLMSESERTRRVHQAGRPR